MPMLLGVSANIVHRRFRNDAPLVRSGLVSIDSEGDLDIVSRLHRLATVPGDASLDVHHLLPGAASANELEWSDFDHVAGAARNASSFVFHPDQSIEENSDGSLTVRFRAGGIDEMCWHLFTWGESVTVGRPARLWRRLVGMCESLAAHHRERWLPRNCKEQTG